MSAAFAEGGRQRILEQGAALSGMESTPQQAALLLDTLTQAVIGWCCREDIPEEMEGAMAILLAQMLKNPEMVTSVTAHCREFQTVRQTARTDLNALVNAGMLIVHKAGNEFIYSPAANLQKLICS